MHVQAAFNELEHFEVEIAKLYGWLAQVYAHDIEAAVVFFRMHLEEKSHASLVRFQRRLARQNPKLFGDVDLDLGILRDTRGIVHALQADPNAPDLRTAVRAAFQIEISAAETHYRSSISPHCDGITHLLNGLSHGDRQHAAALEELGTKRGYLHDLD